MPFWSSIWSFLSEVNVVKHLALLTWHCGKHMLIRWNETCGLIFDPPGWLSGDGVGLMTWWL